jgi:hypothetical protein
MTNPVLTYVLTDIDGATYIREDYLRANLSAGKKDVAVLGLTGQADELKAVVMIDTFEIVEMLFDLAHERQREVVEALASE